MYLRALCWVRWGWISFWNTWAHLGSIKAEELAAEVWHGQRKKYWVLLIYVRIFDDDAVTNYFLLHPYNTGDTNRGGAFREFVEENILLREFFSTAISFCLSVCLSSCWTHVSSAKHPWWPQSPEPLQAFWRGSVGGSGPRGLQFASCFGKYAQGSDCCCRTGWEAWQENGRHMGEASSFEDK